MRGRLTADALAGEAVVSGSSDPVGVGRGGWARED